MKALKLIAKIAAFFVGLFTVLVFLDEKEEQRYITINAKDY